MIDCPGCWAHSVPFTGVGPQVWWLDELTANHTESHITLTRLVAPSIVVFVSHFIGPLWPGAQGHLTSPCSLSQGHKVIWPLSVPCLRGTRSFDLSVPSLRGTRSFDLSLFLVSGAQGHLTSLFLVSGAQGHLTSLCSFSQGHKVIWPLSVPCLRGTNLFGPVLLPQHYSVITLKMSLIFVYMFCFM